MPERGSVEDIRSSNELGFCWLVELDSSLGIGLYCVCAHRFDRGAMFCNMFINSLDMIGRSF